MNKKGGVSVHDEEVCEMQRWCIEKDRVQVIGRSKKSGCLDLALVDNSCASRVDESEKRKRMCENQSYLSSMIADFASCSILHLDCLAFGLLPQHSVPYGSKHPRTVQ